MSTCKAAIMVQEDVKEQFILAILQGKSYHVLRMLDAHPELANIYGGEPLKLCVAYNRRYLTRQLLARGADPKLCEINGQSLILLAARNGYTSVLHDLLAHGHDGGFDLESAVIEAVERGMSASIETMARAGVNVTFGEDEPMFRAFDLKMLHVLKVLVHYGANVDSRDGQLLINACQIGEYTDNMELVRFLLDQGADPNLQQGESMRMCVRHHHSKLLELLLNHGGDEQNVVGMNMSYVIRETIHRWQRQHRLLRLRRAVFSSFNQDTFLWQHMCRKLGNSNIHNVRQQVKIFELEKQKALDDPLSLSSKRKMCLLLAEASEPLLKRDLTLDSTDLCGTLLSDYPAWKIYHINGIAYNIMDLLKLIEKNVNPTCPYTRLPLPVEDIRRRGQFLQKIVTRDAYNDLNLLETVRDMPLLTKEMELQNQLVNGVWNRLSYPPSVRLILDASDSLLDDMINKLFRIIDDAYLYPMLSTWRKYELTQASGLRKKELFIATLVNMMATNDDHSSIRTNILNILFSHYRDDGTTRENEPDDLLTFMIAEDTTSPFANRFFPRLPRVPEVPENDDDDLDDLPF